ncbi:MAG: hypothetical protein U9Q67_02355 [Patescibacteria group bacterium]|nr:hypothetical protein [Patescibacteria group bacterium]
MVVICALKLKREFPGGYGHGVLAGQLSQAVAGVQVSPDAIWAHAPASCVWHRILSELSVIEFSELAPNIPVLLPTITRIATATINKTTIVIITLRDIVIPLCIDRY